MTDPPDELAKVTRRHLRRGGDTCHLRLAREHADVRGNRAADARFAVANRLAADARIAHVHMAPPDATAFVSPTDLFVEQRRLYDAGAAGYLTLFGDAAARAVELEDAWATEVPDLGVRLVGSIGLVLETAAGDLEVRELRVDGSRSSGGLLDDVSVRFAVLRVAPWADGRDVRLVAADLVELECQRVDLDVASTLAPAREWLAARIAEIRGAVDDPRARPGADCAGCPFVAACPAHRAA